jgi:hypothetical protein
MDELAMKKIAEQAYQEERLPWIVSSISPNRSNSDEWEIYYDAFGKKYHKILIRVSEKADSTPESLKAELRSFLRSLKSSSRL